MQAKNKEGLKISLSHKNRIQVKMRNNAHCLFPFVSQHRIAKRTTAKQSFIECRITYWY